MVHLIFVEIVESSAAVVKQHTDLLLCEFYMLLVQFVQRKGRRLVDHVEVIGLEPGTVETGYSVGFVMDGCAHHGAEDGELRTVDRWDVVVLFDNVHHSV